MLHREQKRKEEEAENGVNLNNSEGYQTIIIKQPIELITQKPNVTKADRIPPNNEKLLPFYFSYQHQLTLISSRNL